MFPEHDVSALEPRWVASQLEAIPTNYCAVLSYHISKIGQPYKYKFYSLQVKPYDIMANMSVPVDTSMELQELTR